MAKLFGDSAFEKIYQSSSRQLKKAALAQDGYGLNENLSKNLGYEREKHEASLGLESYQNFQPEFEMQKIIRRYFSKNGINNESIASHPDFKHLDKSDEYIKQYICTMFIDIKGSTTLSLKYDLEFVHKFKNAVIQACIECIRAFDGYVHRIMGDAVLGFFGSKAISKEQSILDCINCASVLNIFLVQNIQPWLREIKPDFQDDTDFGFRIGCNFGDDDEVLWANYGFGQTGEISPTGFSVDIAAKLQGLSGKNKAMLGQGLLEFINWPMDFTSIKVIKKNGIEIQKPFVSPNYTKDKKPINYLMRELKQDTYICGLPIPTYLKNSLASGIIIHCSQIELKNILRVNGRPSQHFISSSMIAPIDSEIEFELHILNDSILKFPLRIKFKKINHEGYGFNHEDLLSQLEIHDTNEFTVSYDASRRTHKHFHKVSISRDCKFRGIHKMICEVRNSDSKLIFREIVHVPIA